MEYRIETEEKEERKRERKRKEGRKEGRKGGREEQKKIPSFVSQGKNKPPVLQPDTSSLNETIKVVAL